MTRIEQLNKRYATKKFDASLGFKEKGLHAAVIMAVGTVRKRTATSIWPK